MKKQILIASLLCAVTTTENYAEHGKNSNKTVASSVATVDVPQMHAYAHTHYREAIEALRERQKISRTEIINLLEKDPYFTRVKTTDGHAKFSHKVFTVTFCVQAHNTTDITGATERRSHHEVLQVYVNTLAKLMHSKSDNPISDWQAVWNMQESAFHNYVNGKKKK